MGETTRKTGAASEMKDWKRDIVPGQGLARLERYFGYRESLLFVIWLCIIRRR